MELLTELWGFVKADFTTKLILLLIIYFILKLNRKTKYLGIYLQAQDHAIEKVIANGKGDQYGIKRDAKIESLMKKDDFESKFKK